MTSDQTLRKYFSNLKRKIPKKFTYFLPELGVDTNPLPKKVKKYLIIKNGQRAFPQVGLGELPVNEAQTVSPPFQTHLSDSKHESTAPTTISRRSCYLT